MAMRELRYSVSEERVEESREAVESRPMRAAMPVMIFS
jgi:hypothetical protein